MLALVLFLILYALACLLGSGAFLLTLPPVVLEMLAIARWIFGFRLELSTDKQILLRKRTTWNLFTRTPCYFFLFIWTTLSEYGRISSQSLTIGVYPIFIYSIISILIEFFTIKFKTIGSFYVMFYKMIRLLVFFELLELLPQLNLDPSGANMDSTGVSQHFWPIHVGALAIIPIAGFTVLYYIYYVIDLKITKSEGFKPHFSKI